MIDTPVGVRLLTEYRRLQAEGNDNVFLGIGR